MNKIKMLHNLIKKYFMLLNNQFLIDLNNFKARKQNKTSYPVDFSELAQQESLFVLSTGRCGTKWLTELLKKSRLLSVEHDPLPKIYFQSQYVYRNNFDLNVIFSSFIHSRYQYLFDSFCNNKKYVETNNRITFYAEAIAKAMPNVRFVHIIRHPYEFIRSGMRRGWYKELNNEFNGHIVPREDDIDFDYWVNYSQEQKIAWLWKRTNEIIEELKHNLNSEQFYIITFNNMFNDKVSLDNLLKFIGAFDLVSNKKMLRNFTQNIINHQKMGDYPEISQWKENTLIEIGQILDNTNLYNFKL